MRKFWGENRRQLLILILLPLLVFPWAATGQSRFAGVDITKLHQPMRWFDVQSVRHGEFPLWNPHIFSGFPQFAEGESGFLYAGNILQYVPVDFSYAFTLVILFHFALAGALAYSCLRHFRLDKRIACGLAVVWAYSPFFMLHLSAPTILIVLALYPAFIQLTDSLPGQPLRRLGWLALLSSQMLFAGSVQMAFTAFFAYFVFAFMRWICSRREIPGAGMRLLWLPLIGVISGGIVAAIQILPTCELISFTERGGQLSESFHAIGSWLDVTRLSSIFIFPLLSNSKELLHYGSSLLYLGLIPGLMFTGGLIYGWRNNSLRVHIIAAIVLILFAMGTRNSFNFWMGHIPPFDKFRYYGRFAGFASWHILVASGIWLSAVMAKYPAGTLDWRKIRGIIGWPVMVAVISIIVFLTLYNVSIFMVAGVLFTIVQLVVMYIFIRRAPWRVHLATVAAVFALLLAYPIGNLLQLDTGEYKRVMGLFEQLAVENPEGRYYMEGEAGLISLEGHGPFFLTPYRTMKGFAGGNAASMAGLNVLSGYTPLKYKSWRDIEPGVLAGDADTIVGILSEDRIAADYIVVRDEIPNETAEEINSIYGYKLRNDLDLTGIAGDGGLFESPTPSSPFMLKPKIEIVYPEPLNKEPARVLAHTSGGPGKPWQRGFSIDVYCPVPCDMLILIPWYPGWEVKMDNKEKLYTGFNDIYAMLHNIPVGEHTIEFTYRPKSFRDGMIISIVGLLVSILLIVIPSGRKAELVK